jgi:hypothetical protein
MTKSTHRRVDADDAARTAAVVDHHALPQPLAELRSDGAPDHVIASPWRERDDHLEGLGRIGLRRRHP